MIKAIKGFIWHMLAEKGEISSKRCIASSGMATLIFLSVQAQMANKRVEEHVFDMLVVVVLGAAGITAWEKGKAFSNKASGAPEAAPDAANTNDNI